MNLHGLHARELNLYERDAGYIHALLQRKGIEVFIYRPNISGTTDALTQFIENCTQRLVLPKTIREARQVYKVRPDCDTPSLSSSLPNTSAIESDYPARVRPEIASHDGRFAWVDNPLSK